MRLAMWIGLIVASGPLWGQVRRPQQEGANPPSSNTIRREHLPALESPGGLTPAAPPSTSPVVENEYLPFTQYRLGPEDLLSVTVLDSPEFTRMIRVSGAGSIKLPLMKNEIAAEGKTAMELERAITQALVDEGLLRQPMVSVTVREFNSKPITVSGAVRSPLVFQAIRPLTLVEAIARAGGLSDNAGQEILISVPQGKDNPAKVVRVSTKALTELSDPKANITLHGGEEVRVPQAGRVYLIGGVTRPGAVLITEDQPLTLLQALALAGGPVPTASSKATLLRPASSGSPNREIAVNLKKLMKRETPDVVLGNNDVIFVPDSQSKRMTQAGVSTGISSMMYGLMGVLLWR